jgi:hypothetical protein
MSFESHVLEKLNELQAQHAALQIQLADRLARIEERLPEKDGKSKWVERGGITVSAGAVSALLSFIAQHWK